jgi:hypothetical protein
MILPVYKYSSPFFRKGAFDVDNEDNFREVAQNMILTFKNAGVKGMMKRLLPEYSSMNKNILREYCLMISSVHSGKTDQK